MKVCGKKGAGGDFKVGVAKANVTGSRPTFSYVHLQRDFEAESPYASLSIPRACKTGD
jgi:hypothetical protein